MYGKTIALGLIAISAMTFTTFKMRKSSNKLNQMLNRLEKDMYVQQVIREAKAVSRSPLEFEAYCAMQGVRVSVSKR